jgi:hypothetical protein
MSTAYRFDNLWRLPAPRERVYAVLADVDGYTRWWPQVREIHRIDADSGQVRIRSVLPYTLDLVLTRALEDQPGGILRVDIEGDLVGWCAWQVIAEGSGTQAQFSQEVEVTAALLQKAPFAVRPMFRANHAYMMRAGERALASYLS